MILIRKSLRKARLATKSQKVKNNMKNANIITTSELKSFINEMNSQYFVNSCCKVVKDDSNETTFKVSCNMFSEALTKTYAKSTTLCFRFDSSKCDFAKKYLAKYITKDMSDVVSQVSKKIFIECTIPYENVEQFLSVLAKATDKAIDNSQLFAKKSRATAKKATTVAKQSQKTATVAKKATKQSQKTAK